MRQLCQECSAAVGAVASAFVAAALAVLAAVVAAVYIQVSWIYKQEV